MGLGAVGTGAALVLAEIRHWEALLCGALLAQAGPAELGGWGCLPARAPPPTWAQTKWPNQRWPKPIALSWGLACAKSWQLTKETPTMRGGIMGEKFWCAPSEEEKLNILWEADDVLAHRKLH